MSCSNLVITLFFSLHLVGHPMVLLACCFPHSNRSINLTLLDYGFVPGGLWVTGLRQPEMLVSSGFCQRPYLNCAYSLQMTSFTSIHMLITPEPPAQAILLSLGHLILVDSKCVKN